MARRNGWGWAGSFLCVGICLLSAAPARGSFHLWQIVEAYSNASGSVQFIEMLDQSDFEDHVGGHSMTSNGHTFNVVDDLSTTSTSTHRLLFATPGYIALSGVPAADYNLGVNNFFSTTGDTLNWAGVNSLTFTSVQLPLNDVNSINRAYNASAFTSAVNSPTNFAGATGTVPEPATLSAGLLFLGAMFGNRQARPRR